MAPRMANCRINSSSRARSMSSSVRPKTFIMPLSAFVAFPLKMMAQCCFLRCLFRPAALAAMSSPLIRCSMRCWTTMLPDQNDTLGNVFARWSQTCLI
ncbi:hypothetical protein D3C86_1844020 [compost metagenome]